jgi:hypothetical protein
MYPYHIYMDLDVINNDYTSTKHPHLRFEETRNTPFLDGDSSDYFCSILRFSIQTGNSLPVFIPRVQVGQSDPNLTIYKITLEWELNQVVYQGSAYVRYEPQSDWTEPINSPITAQDLTTTYYHVYSYQHFINMINLAFINALNDLQNAMGSAWIPIAAPYLEWDTASCTASLLTPLDAAGNVILSVYFNTRLYELFAGLPAYLMSETGEKNYRMQAAHFHGHTTTKRKGVKLYQLNSNQTTTGDRDFHHSIQETSSIATWNPIASIVFASTLLPIQPTQTSMPKDIGQSSNNLKGGGNNSNLLNILSDFAIPVGPNNEYRPIIEYVPQSEYRLLDMNSSMNLNRVDVHVYWKDQFGVLHPLLLRPGCSAHVKLMFRRKDFDVVI